MTDKFQFSKVASLMQAGHSRKTSVLAVRFWAGVDTEALWDQCAVVNTKLRSAYGRKAPITLIRDAVRLLREWV